MHGLMENAIYGGRVDNTYDMRVLTSYLVQFFNSTVLSGHNMSPLRGGGKALPCGSLPVSHVRRDYLSLISSLPDTDSHALFGLPANIEQSLQRTISSKVLSQLRVVARAEGSAERFDREVWSAELSPLLNLWKKLNQGSELITKKVSPPSDKLESPVLAFVSLERFNAVRLVQKVHSSLASLNRVLRGSSLLSTDVHRLAGALLRHEVPVSWLREWEGPEEPALYLRSLVGKTLALGVWEERGREGRVLQDTLDLSELFHPDTFLNALRQQTARAMKCSMDSLKLVCSWKPTGIPATKLSIKIAGVQLEGCSFDGSKLTENSHDSPSVVAMPPCTVAWVTSEAPPPYPPEECLSVPVYQSGSRERLVTCVDVHCGRQGRETWLQKNPALFLNN
ncbi:Cytoplasmic dynein 2 heavy chain 1 [Geodia barretti]|uniref:Cytoplasmic dynein 2 heavy chain 1 n=1 Tax=Geodia barretti TaxID=519541 RepID=A0AA35XAN6_GEOBA|nr:Cytoplasmic dynein 2 heavy chain 1 [Geodia barretti]